MPSYDYVCLSCNHKEEIFQKISEAAIEKCPKCHSLNFRRGPGGGIGLQFNSGFYNTGYQSSSPSKKPTTGSSTAGTQCRCGKSACKS